MDEQEYADFLRAYAQTLSVSQQSLKGHSWDKVGADGKLVVTDWNGHNLCNYVPASHFAAEGGRNERVLLTGTYQKGAASYMLQMCVERFPRGDSIVYQITQIYAGDENFGLGLRILNGEINFTTVVKNRELVNGCLVPHPDTYKSIDRIEVWVSLVIDNLEVILEERYADADTIPNPDHQGFQFLEAFKENAVTTSALLSRLYRERE